MCGVFPKQIVCTRSIRFNGHDVSCRVCVCVCVPGKLNVCFVRPLFSLLRDCEILNETLPHSEAIEADKSSSLVIVCL